MMIRAILAGLLVVCATTWSAAQTAQPAGKSDPTPLTTSPAEIGKDASAVLPSAGASGPSAAPTMVRDCVKNPQDCTTPISPGDRATAAGDQSTPNRPAPK